MKSERGLAMSSIKEQQASVEQKTVTNEWVAPVLQKGDIASYTQNLPTSGDDGLGDGS